MMSFVEDHGCHGLETWTFEASPITKLQQVELNISPFVRHVQYLTVIMNGWQKVIVRVASRPGVLFGLQNWVRGRTLFGVEIRKSEKMVSELRIVSLIFKKKNSADWRWWLVVLTTLLVVNISDPKVVKFLFGHLLMFICPEWLPCPLIWFRTPLTHWTHRRFPNHYAIFLKRKKMTTTLKRLKFVRKWERTLG